ncbi:MAG TPA: SDR family oxidoreductase [Acidimicrobiia bacterium]|nr:SDR family oxidoreductase [Acidimicrobiia bacterium]
MSGLCVVTGASRGIGRAVAHRMAADGYEVLATGRDEAALAETADTAPATIETARLDVSNPAEIDELFAGLDVDVLVNNAGVAPSAPVHRTTLEDWEWVIRVNATGPFLCTRAVLPGMRERDHGRVITVASMASHRGTRYTAAYTASKHAALGFIRVVAAELAGTGVTANAVCPAYVDTPMTANSVERMEEKTGMDEETARKWLANVVPLGRLLDPAEVAHAVAFLAAPQSGAINGQSILLDGGGLQK